MKQNIKIVLIVLVLALGAGILIAQKYWHDPNKTSIKIGALLVLSGDGAAWGENAKKGIDMAFREWQRSHKDQSIEIIYEDTAGDAKQAVTAYQKLVNVDKIDVIFL